MLRNRVTRIYSIKLFILKLKENAREIRGGVKGKESSSKFIIKIISFGNSCKLSGAECVVGDHTRRNSSAR